MHGSAVALTTTLRARRASCSARRPSCPCCERATRDTRDGSPDRRKSALDGDPRGHRDAQRLGTRRSPVASSGALTCAESRARDHPTPERGLFGTKSYGPRLSQCWQIVLPGLRLCSRWANCAGLMPNPHPAFARCSRSGGDASNRRSSVSASQRSAGALRPTAVHSKSEDQLIVDMRFGARSYLTHGYDRVPVDALYTETNDRLSGDPSN
jgi:hypothetical protein